MYSPKLSRQQNLASGVSALKRSLFAELKRRNVFRAGIAYLALGWVVTQVTSTVAPQLHLPDWIGSVVIWIGVIGFPFVIMFSWVYEITPEGLKRESEVDRSASITHVTARRLDYIIIGMLALAMGLFAFDRFAPRRGGSTASGEATAPAAVSAGATAPSTVPTATSISVATSDNSIAVLPFVDMSQAKDQEYFSDGITEELLNLLAKIPQLQVTARTSSFSFKGKELGIKDIAKTLGVTHVLEGSVRKSGDQIRITAQLINAVNDKHLWSETYDRKLDDIFRVQDEIAGKVVEELKVTLLGAAPSVRTTDPKAYALYLQAKQLGRQFTSEGFAKSDELYKQVLSIDPRYAPAWVGLSSNVSNEAQIGILSSQQASIRGSEAAERALAIDPDYGPAHAALGWNVMSYHNDLAGAAKHFQRALALAPTDLNVLGNATLLVEHLGRPDVALALLEALARRDPVNATALTNLALTQRYIGRYDEAIASYRTVLSLAPGRGGVRANLGTALLLNGDASGALGEIERETSEPWRMMSLPMAYHALGRHAESNQALAALVGKYEKDSSYNVAYIYAFRGEADKAFEWLDKAVEYQDPGISEIVNENLFANIRSDPRWLPFLRKVDKAPDQLAKIEFKVTLPKEWQAEATAQAAANPAATAR
jgi:TolB-like protein/tetratricopeptide (TPR) repeat protein